MLCSRPSSSDVNPRCFETEPATRTAVTRSSRRMGMNATLFAPSASTSRLLTIFEAAASYTANGAASNAAVATPDGSFSRSRRTPENQSRSRPFTRPTTPFPMLVSSSMTNRQASSMPAASSACTVHTCSRLPPTFLRETKPTPSPEGESGGQSQDSSERQGQPDPARRRFPLDRQDDPVHGRDEPNRGEDHGQSGLELKARPLFPERRAEPRRGPEVCGSHNEQRHRVEPQSLFGL